MFRYTWLAALAACAALAWPVAADATGYSCLMECHQTHPWSPDGSWGSPSSSVLRQGNACMQLCTDELEQCLTSNSQQINEDFADSIAWAAGYSDYEVDYPRVEERLAQGLTCARRYVVNKPPSTKLPAPPAASLCLIGGEQGPAFGISFEQGITPRISARQEIWIEDREATDTDPAYLSGSVLYYLSESRLRPYLGAGLGVLIGPEGGDPAVQLAAGVDLAAWRRARFSLEARYREFELRDAEWQAVIRVGIGSRRRHDGAH